MAEVVIRNLKKIYNGGIVACRDLNLTIGDREFIVLVGPSGCGKSTTLRMIAGLEDITEGELYIDGKKVNDVPAKDRDIAMVFQNYALYPHMTVFENMAIPLRMRKVEKRVIREKVEQTADILGLSGYLKRKPGALSGGERQRVAMGRAMVREPKVFLMDEPLSNLDALLRNQMRAEIFRLRERINATFIYVTHDQTEAMTLGDRIVVMKDGRVNQIGTPEELFEKPVNMFVAGFIGTPRMNMIYDCQLEDHNGVYDVRIADVRIDLPVKQQQLLRLAGQQPQEVVCGIRPCHITVGEGRLKGQITMAERMGAEVNVHMHCAENDMTAVVSSVTYRSLAQEKEVLFDLMPEEIQLFDPESGRNLIWYDGQSDKACAPVCRRY